MAHIELPLTEPFISFTSTGDCEVRRTVHSSGLRVLTERVPGSRSVTIGFWIGAGSRDEDAGHHGSTHFLEHLLFKGTSTRGAFEISETFDAMGAFHNALTAKENTCYLARVRSKDLATAVRVLGDQVSNSLLRPDDFEMERTVILEELAMAADDPDDVCAEQFFTAIFGDSPLARPIGGTVDDIEGALRDSVVEHYADRYQPRDLIVTAAGDVSHDDLVAMVLDSLVGWTLDDGAPEARRSQTEVAIAERHDVLVTNRPLEQVVVMMGIPGVVASDPRRNDLNVLTSILGGGSSSRLFQEIREKRGLAYSVDAFPVMYSDAGAVGIAAGCAPHAVAEVAQLMRDGLESMTSVTDGEMNRARGQILGSSTLSLESMTSVTDGEMNRARGQILGSSTLSLESTDSRMNRLARSEFLGEYRDLDEAERLLAAVSSDSVTALAATLIAEPMSISAVGDISPDTFAFLTS